MAKPKSPQKRQAILEAAVAVIAEHGTSASTLSIAKTAKVAHGSVFSYFETKTELLNEVFVHLKGGRDDTVFEGLPDPSDPVAQLRHIWVRLMEWGTANPVRRRALRQLDVSGVITSKTRHRTNERSAVAIEVVRRVSAAGSFREQPIEFMASFFEALGGSTMDFMIAEPEHAESYRDAAFEALQKALS